MLPISLSLLLNALDQSSGGVRIIQVQTDNEYHYGLCECLLRQQEAEHEVGDGGGGECCCSVKAPDSGVETNLYNVEIRQPRQRLERANQSGPTTTTANGRKSSLLLLAANKLLMNDMINRLLCRPLALPIRLLKHLIESRYSLRELLLSRCGSYHHTDPSSDNSRLDEEAVRAITDLLVTERPRAKMTVIS